MARIEEKIGNIYEDFQIIEKNIEKTKQKKRAFYNVKCIHCGFLKSISGTHLRQKNGTKCPICKKIKLQSEEIGNKYGSLTVIDFDHIASDRRYVWKCKCDCGNIITVRITSLHDGSVTQCHECIKKKGCQPNLTDETGKRYGILTVLERDWNKNNNGSAYWKCKCDCGNIITVKGAKLRFGQTSCGCLKSKGEFKINNILSQNKIKYKTQVIVDNCKSISDLRFDFGIYNDKDTLLYLIEYDGQQHFYPTGGWFNNEDFEDIQKRDLIKNQWCKQNNIPLIRIPYTKYDTLELKDLLLKDNQYVL